MFKTLEMLIVGSKYIYIYPPHPKTCKGQSARRSAVLFAIFNVCVIMFLTYCEKTQGFLVCNMLIVDMQMSKNVELRAPNG